MNVMPVNDKKNPPILSSAIAAGVAALMVSTIVYPLDTLKTRIQSGHGFEKAGGFRGVYKGLSAMISASVPINCFFFGAYETIKTWTEPHVTPQTAPVVHLLGASLCRVTVCLIRVPSEIVKQRKQMFVHEKTKSAFNILFHAYKREGIRHGLYRGFASTVVRDLPYSLIEIPSWELLKKTVARYNDKEITSLQSAVCGMLAGGIAGSITTPFDLAKTRIMLADVKKPTDFDKLRIKIVLANIYVSSGFRGLFAGIYLRTAMVMMGRFLFFGIYEEIKNFLNVYICGSFINLL